MLDEKNYAAIWLGNGDGTFLPDPVLFGVGVSPVHLLSGRFRSGTAPNKLDLLSVDSGALTLLPNTTP